MTDVYFDSSALVKLLVTEQGSQQSLELWDRCDVAVSSRLAYPEVCAALAAARRARRLTNRRLDTTRDSWELVWSSTVPVELTGAVERAAGRLAEAHVLSGADAVHLASALAVVGPDFLFAAWDERLRAGARAEGLVVVPA